MDMIKRIHFIGIGGIGISALAKFLRAQGVEISGSDVAEGSLTKELKAMGIKVSIPHSKEAICGQDLVIHSAIIKEDNIEVQEARAQNIPVLSRKESLKRILGNKEVFAVAGAHGKSTTTAILSAILKDASALIGAESKEFQSNTRALDGNRVVFEADESDKSFLECNPTCAIVTNAEPEHMEAYEYDLVQFYQAYESFLRLAKICIINAEDSFLGGLENLGNLCVRFYPSKDLQNIRYIVENGMPKTQFSLTNANKDYGTFSVYGLGEHIAIDAALAILAASQILPLNEIRKNIQNYCGIKKRFDILTQGECVIIDDYAHHPTEITATLKALKKYQELTGAKQLVAIWQPHKYSRIKDNLEGFIACFKGVDALVILPVYAAGEDAIAMDFVALFARYNPIFVDEVKRTGNALHLFKDSKQIACLEKGILVGFNAGNLTYALRGGI
ncbi:UDP-N-acetylmuramate--L-alanine ligase [Helicobacter sp.]|uniref:UDP-N-acetylmuramate--L-alanine ligase n=1 Tax=Helicobacter sp. TaxID=218 RepID=UPI0025C1E489|nr:UDP-N-acetylmuramate--L-alanine ligase [Helicobacter sp.]MCI5969516.1 UDP-N-acetylmuramate--L-alanine ligase [Helicobacter sp.]MDY2584784.1 UDP-N-acetylmuramate--L-alanine ligase [Helicobacter sp.]